MAADVDVRIIQKTQSTLGTVIKKPPLSEKLLKKPPFRFLHDVITNVITNTGFFEGLYTADELVSENVKEKESKIAFLQKAIDVVSMVTGETLLARPSKIVAGQEPAKTNEFLQAIAKALIQKQSSADAVKRVLKGEKPSADKKPSRGGGSVDRKPKVGAAKSTKEASNKTSKDTAKTSSKDAAKTTKVSINSTKDASKPNRTTKEPNKVTKPVKAPTNTSKSTKEELKAPKKKDELKQSKSPKRDLPLSNVVINSPVKVASPVPITDDSTVVVISEPVMAEPVLATPQTPPKPEPVASTSEPDIKSPASDVRPPPSARPAAPSRQSRRSNHVSAKASKPEPIVPVREKNDFSASMNGEPVPRPQSVMRARSARPSTARPAPPRIINRNIVNPEESARTPSAKPVSNLILDTDSKENEDDEG